MAGFKRDDIALAALNALQGEVDWPDHLWEPGAPRLEFYLKDLSARSATLDLFQRGTLGPIATVEVSVKVTLP